MNSGSQLITSSPRWAAFATSSRCFSCCSDGFAAKPLGGCWSHGAHVRSAQYDDEVLEEECEYSGRAVDIILMHYIELIHTLQMNSQTSKIRAMV